MSRAAISTSFRVKKNSLAGNSYLAPTVDNAPVTDGNGSALVLVNGISTVYSTYGGTVLPLQILLCSVSPVAICHRPRLSQTSLSLLHEMLSDFAATTLECCA